MELIPVIDLRQGRAVHARGGRREEYRPVESALAPAGPGDAMALARACRAIPGVRNCYLADLDAIGGGATQTGLIRRLASEEGFGPGLWVDAGVRRPGEVESLVAAGVSSIVVGLETLGALSELPELVRAAGSIPVRFSLDLRNGQPVGRFTAPPPSPLALAAQAASAGAAATIVLDLARVGAESGPAHLDLIATLKARLGHPVYHGGGVRHAADLDALAAAGCDGALVGTALHSGRLGPRYCTTGNR